MFDRHEKEAYKARYIAKMESAERNKLEIQSEKSLEKEQKLRERKYKELHVQKVCMQLNLVPGTYEIRIIRKKKKNTLLLAQRSIKS